MNPVVVEKVAKSPTIGDAVTTTIKISLIATIAVVVGVALYFIVKRLKKESENKSKVREQAQLAAELEKAGAKEAELTTNQSEAIAQKVYNAVDGWGTDEEAVLKAIETIPTAADYLNVKSIYQRNYNSDMWVDIEDDMDNDEEFIMCIAHLNKISVPENLR